MSNAKKVFYTVVKGRLPGVYQRWSGEGGAEEQVKGFPGALFKGFATRAEAEYYLHSGGKELPSAQLIHLSPEQPLTSAALPAGLPRLDYQDELESGKIVIFTDGSSLGNPGPGGYGVVILQGEKRNELSGGFRCTTNNRMELLACIAALRLLKNPGQVILYSDSAYVVNAVVKGWARRWRENGWMRLPDAKGTPQRAENTDLWEDLLALLDELQVEFRWVKGHASSRENARCDRLAVQAAQKRNLLTDPGYQGSCA